MSLFYRRLEYNYPRIEYGKGIRLFDENQKSYIDAVGGAGVASLGHGLDYLADDIAALVRKLCYIHGSQFTSKTIERLAEKLVSVAPEEYNRVLFTCSGSETVETGIKLAYQYHKCKSGNHKKHKVLYTAPSYHGSTLMALSITGKSRDQKAFSSLLTPQPKIPSPTCYRCPIGLEPGSCQTDCVDLLEEAILAQNPEECLCFVIEPVIGAANGVTLPPPNYLQRAKALCAKYDITLIFDEILCGFGRTGEWFAGNHWGVTPDITLHGKGIAAGIVPLSAVYCTDEIVDTIRSVDGNFSHGFTFTNHHLSLGIAELVFDHMIENDLLGNVRKMQEVMHRELNQLAADIDIVDSPRGLGLMWGFEIVADKISKAPFARDKHMAEKILGTAMKKGLNLYFSIGYLPDGSGDSIMMSPPYNITEDEIKEIVGITRQSIEEVLAAESVYQTH